MHKKILLMIMILVIMVEILVSCNQNMISTSSQAESRRPVKVGVVMHTFDPYKSLIHQNLEKIQEENSGKVEFFFGDSKDNEAIQDEIVDRLLKEKNVDVLLLNLVHVSENSVESAINKIKQKNIPVILFFSLEPARMNSFKAYEKAFVVTTDANQADIGMLEGQILVDLWNSKKGSIDKNGDNIMQYVMLRGPRSEEVDARTRYSILAINNAGIKVEELASQNCEWNREVAENTVNGLFLKYDGKIEAIIANNDDMAIGAIEALQKYGYNKGDKMKTIAVVGIDGIPEAQELIKNGFMTGTVFQDPYDQAKDLYTFAMNLFYNKEPVEGTDYKFDKDEKVIYMPSHVKK